MIRASSGLRPHDLTLTRRSLYQAELSRHASVKLSEFIKSLSGFDQMKKSISGIRGIFGKDFSLKDALKFCNNFSSLVDSKKCVIAKDTRPSGHMILDTVSASLRGNGIDVFNLGINPTPVVFREARKYGAGIVITSSHNPLEWNGLKFILNGKGINEKELESVITDQNLPKSKIGSESIINSNYVEEAADLVGAISNPVKVSIDVGGGAAAEVTQNLLKKIGCEVTVINENLQSTSRGPDPTNDDLLDLIKNSETSEIGFAFDLDGDRLVVCKNGKKQTPDVTLGLGVSKALEKGYKKFVLSIDTSISIEKFIKQHGGKVERSKVGEANVIDLMLKTGSQAGGEGSSGGFILPEFNYCRDGIISSGLIASMLGQKSFSETLSFMESYHQLRDKVSADSNIHDEILDQLYRSMKNDFSEIITIDGIKGIIDEDSWVLVRKSNTEDIIRVSAESNNLEKGKTVLNKTKELVNRYYEQIR